MKKSITVKKTFDINSPVQMTNLSKVLKDHIIKNKLSVNIKGKDYAMVEGWQFAGGMVGLFPMIKETVDLSKTGETKWKALCDLINLKTDKIVGRGEALCSNKENNKKNFDEYAILSMAQTRSIGKAYRNMLGWVMKLAGYEATPSEEMLKVGEMPISSPKVEQKDDFENFVPCQNNCGAMVSPAAVEYYKKHKAKKILCRDCIRVKK